jgi:hypothetical protein
MQKWQKNLVFYGGAALMVGTLWLVARPRPFRYVPLDEHHPRPLAVAACRDCHAPGKMAPQSAKHPPKDKCMLCHRDQSQPPK